MRHSEIRKIAFVGDYLPRKCGIATFTHDMYASVAGRFPDAECFVVPVNDRPEGYDYPPEVRFEIDEQDLESYRRAADFLNFANTDVVCLQHEYGIYGGAGRQPRPRPAARPADAGRHDLPHRPARAERRPAAGPDANWPTCPPASSS